MKIFGFNITRTEKALTTPERGGRWYPINDFYTGAWQQNHREQTQAEVLAYSTVYACVTLISNQIAKLPLQLIELQDNVWRPVEKSAFSPLLRRPSRQYNRIAWTNYLVNSLMIDGNAYGFRHYDNRGVLTSISLLDPGSVEVLIADPINGMPGEVFYRIRGPNKLAGLTDTQIIVPADAMIHWRLNPLYHPMVGCSPLRAALHAANVGSTIMKREEVMHNGRPQIGGILKLPQGISRDQVQLAKEAWDLTTKSGGTAVLEHGVDFVPLMFDAQEMETIAALKLANEDIARAFNVPAYLINVGQAPSTPNNEVMMRAFYDQTLQPIIEEIELTLDEALGLPNNLGVQFDLSPLLRLDTASRWDAKTKAIGGGLLTINEARADEGLEPLEGGDTVYMQQQDFPLHVIKDNKLPSQEEAAPALSEDKPEESEEQPEDEEEVQKGIPMVYREIWTEGETYNKGDAVTYKGALWVALDKSVDKPGTSHNWRLAVKSGKGS